MHVKMTNEKWMSLSIDEVEKKLNTSAASGLSRKAARGRLQKAGENAFFLLPTTSAADCIRIIIRQPSTILLLLLSVLLMIFEQAQQGRLLLGLTLTHAAALVIMRLWTEHIYRIPARSTRPLVKVIREGQLFLLDSTRLVPGDLIELEPGDMAPCDLRLLSTQGMRVLTYLGEENSAPSYVRSVKSCTDIGIPYVTDISNHGNMVYGGSVIEQGYARALVVETGKHTYIGALQGGYPIKVERTLPGNAENMKKIASQFQIILLFAVLPIMCLCLLLQKTEAGLPLLFSTLLCLCLANLTGHMETLLNFGMAIGVRRAMNAKESDSPSLIKTEKSPDRITGIDYLFLFGPHAFSEQPLPSASTMPANSLAGMDDDRIRRQALQFALGNHLLGTCEDDINALCEAGIRPILVITEESRYAITYIMRTGIVENASEIALASHFHARKESITADFGKYRAYCGFSNEELKMLVIFAQKNGKRVAMLASTGRESSLLKQADIRFFAVDDLQRFIDPIKSREKKPEMSRPDEGMLSSRMRLRADILIPYANRKGGGIASILRALHLASDVTYNLILVARYLIYAQLIRTLFIVPTTLLGVHMIQPIQIAFSGLCLDLILSCVLLFRVGERKPHNIRDLPSDTRKTTALAAFCASLLTLLCFWGIHTHYTDTSAAPSALLTTMLTLQITFFFICWNPIVSLKKSSNRKHLLMLLILGLGLLALGAIFGFLKHLGIAWSSAPYGYLPLIGAISALLISLIIRIYRSGLSR